MDVRFNVRSDMARIFELRGCSPEGMMGRAKVPDRIYAATCEASQERSKGREIGPMTRRYVRFNSYNAEAAR
ncbi:hypothetical protein C5Y93_00015 [Blastopirellula marina]|uniref:Uncharacterized protein n=1 Tax=Blastopirellula marina TaxID=124 RepID=A0A2S8GUM5_9BACT|nr:hypothetical protein C5Y93_00015 [Blastopirellula marina]